MEIEESFLDKFLRSFMDDFILKYQCHNDDEWLLVHKYINDFKTQVKDSNVAILSFIPKENVDVVMKYLNVASRESKINQCHIVNELEKTTYKFETIMLDFHLTLRNDLYRKLNILRNNETCCTTCNEHQMGIWILNLNNWIYNSLKRNFVNTIDDLVCMKTEDLEKIVGKNVCKRIRDKVQKLGYTFVGDNDSAVFEQSEDSENRLKK